MSPIPTLVSTSPRISASGLSKQFKIARSRSGSAMTIDAVLGVDVRIDPGEILGVVGESGCGKSTLGRLLAGLMAPSSGLVDFGGVRLSDPGRIASGLKGRVQMVFQDPGRALDPRMRIGACIAEPLVGEPRAAQGEKVSEMLSLVGLPSDAQRRLPHELSGGEQQRACIARALVAGADIVILDEVVSALDPVLRNQILLLLDGLRSRLGTSYMFISHDLHAVNALSDRVAVMYLGQIVETVPVAAFAGGALLHPYSVALRSSILRVERGKSQTAVALHGEVPSPGRRPRGCPFRTRCPIAADVCAETNPPLLLAAPGHGIACHFPGKATVA